MTFEEAGSFPVTREETKEKRRVRTEPDELNVWSTFVFRSFVQVQARSFRARCVGRFDYAPLCTVTAGTRPLVLQGPASVLARSGLICCKSCVCVLC